MGTSSIRDDSSEDTRLYIHGMGHQKHVIKLMQDAGVRKVSKTEEIPWGEGEEANAICFLHKTAGCDCGAAWRCIPRQFLSMLGGKVAMEKLFRTYGLSEIYPKTFINLQEYLRGREEHNTPGKASKWFVKVSHMNSRKMMICSTDSDEISEHVESFPATYKYVIQKEVENPLLIDGHKTLLRLWVLVTYHPDGTTYLHFSRRLRLNKLQAEYDVDSSSAEADLCHKTSCIYKDASLWPLYRKMWSQCVDVAELIIKTVMKKWLEHPGFGPPESGGLYNIFAMDYVPTEDGQAVLIEANVDPGFKNKCPETKLAAEDLVAFFFLPVLTSGSFTIPDRNFHTVTIEAKPPSGPSPPDTDADMEECGDE
eukprot:TRINITY_DN3476_c0_g1_i1.p1 TRINITY_DN3476_c0_g1~~TRINITY_DN3476_c0_g1_i1.p1  ORF type:complete len:388 (+),score=59.63 TRINITY_DN3476_c0_g1_i1:66-1166(+)